jgi:hypothetical protein
LKQGLAKLETSQIWEPVKLPKLDDARETFSLLPLALWTLVFSSTTSNLRRLTELQIPDSWDNKFFAHAQAMLSACDSKTQTKLCAPKKTFP